VGDGQQVRGGAGTHRQRPQTCSTARSGAQAPAHPWWPLPRTLCPGGFQGQACSPLHARAVARGAAAGPQSSRGRRGMPALLALCSPVGHKDGRGHVLHLATVHEHVRLVGLRALHAHARTPVPVYLVCVRACVSSVCALHACVRACVYVCVCACVCVPMWSASARKRHEIRACSYIHMLEPAYQYAFHTRAGGISHTLTCPAGCMRAPCSGPSHRTWTSTTMRAPGQAGCSYACMHAQQARACEAT